MKTGEVILTEILGGKYLRSHNRSLEQVDQFYILFKRYHLWL